MSAMILKLRSWWQKTSKTLDDVINISIVILLVLFVMIILGYIFNWPWTGLHGRTLYDWLQLLIIPAVLAVGGYLFNYTTVRNEQKATQQRDQTERDIASDNQREAALQAYIDSMSGLLLEKNLRNSGDDDEVRKIARVRTLTVLRRLDKYRKRSVLQFLHESGLIDKDNKIIDLHGADIREADLHGVNLSGDDLSGAYLQGVYLSGAILREANLSRTNMLSANLYSASLIGTDLAHTILVGASLSEADLSRANLQGALMRFPHSSEGDLGGVHLGEPGLYEAGLHGANLSEANLTGAKVTDEQLKQAKTLEGATMPDGSQHA